MNLPRTVLTAVADQPVDGRLCLEAGAGVGAMSAALLDAGAKRVYAMSNDRADVLLTRRRMGSQDGLEPLEADLQEIPLKTESIELITAHGLCNLLNPESLQAVTDEFNRIACPGCRLIVDDYDPLSKDAEIRQLFAIENAAAALGKGDAAVTFYPSRLLKRQFSAAGWTFERELTLLEPVPWTGSHLSAHANVVEELSPKMPSPLDEYLSTRAQQLVTTIGHEDAGRMYSLAFSLSE